MPEPTSLREEIAKMSGEDLAVQADAVAINLKNTPGQLIRNVLVWEEIAKRLRASDPQDSAKLRG